MVLRTCVVPATLADVWMRMSWFTLIESDGYRKHYAPGNAGSRAGMPLFLRLLEILARAQTSEDAPALTDLLANQIAGLPWGATLILITSQADDSLLDSLFHARRAGLNAVVILVGHGQGFSAFRSRAGRFGFTVYEVARERDMVSPSTL